MKMIIVDNDGNQVEFEDFLGYGFTRENEDEDEMSQAGSANSVQVIIAYKEIKKLAEKAAEEIGLPLEDLLSCIESEVIN